MYKITGYLSGAYTVSPESGADPEPVEHTIYAKNTIMLKLKLLYMKLFYDWVEVEEI